MSRIRRAWAVLWGADPHRRLLLSYRAMVADRTATIARLSAEAKRRDALLREAHALLGRAITDDGVPQP